MRKPDNKGKGNDQGFPRSHFLIGDLLAPVSVLPGAGNCPVVRIIPPRETLSDPAHLEAFFITLASLLSQVAGNGQLVGGRVSGGTDSKQHDKEKVARRAFLNELENGKEELSQTALLNADRPEITARLKGLRRRHRREWQHVVSFEIAGRYQEVCFLVRVADPALLSPIVALLRQEYPHLAIEKLNTDPQKAAHLNHSLTNTLSVSTGIRRNRTNQGQILTSYEEKLHKERSFDPLVQADVVTRQLSLCRWLLLSEHPTMPLALPSIVSHPRTNNGGRETDLKATPLRRLLATLADLQPGEIACSQLLVFGPVAKEWVKYQEAQTFRMQEVQSASFQGSVSKLRDDRRCGIPPNAHRSSPHSIPPSTDNRGLIIITILLALLCVGIIWWQEFEVLLEANDLTRLAIWMGQRLVLSILALAVVIAIWWVARTVANGGRRKGEVFSLQAVEEKLSSPLILGALRQVTSINFEPYLYQTCCDPLHKARFARYGFAQIETARLYQIRQEWLQQDATSSTTATLDNSAGKHIEHILAEINTPENEELWEFVVETAQTLAEKRLDELQESMAASYAPFGSATANAFVTVPGPTVPAQCYSSLLPYDWHSPQRLRNTGLASLWPFNSSFFDWLIDLFDRELPPAVREHRGLLILNALELSYLWHLPGGYETLDFVERTGPKTMSPEARILQPLDKLARSDDFLDGYRSSANTDKSTSPLFGLEDNDVEDLID